jgi:EpsI family protein
VLATLAFSVLWYLAWTSGIEVGYLALLPLLLLGAVGGALGPAALATLAFPIGYLYFAIPVWSLINTPLQSLTTFGVSLMIRVTGVPAYIEGNHVHIPAGTFEIAGGCSGLHFFIVALSISALYGELGRDRLPIRLKLLALAAVLGVLMNWVRVYTIILQGHLTDMQGYLVKVDHYKFGWVLFAVLLVIFFWLARRIAPDPIAEPAPAASLATSTGFGKSLVGLAVSLAAMLSGPALAQAASRMAGPGEAALTLPAAANGWAGPGVADPSWMPRYFGQDAVVQGTYERGPAAVSVYLNAYLYQAQGHELVFYENDVLGGEPWQALSERGNSVNRASGGRFPYVEIEATAADGSRWLVARTQVVGGRVFDREIASKLYYGVAVLRGAPVSGLVAAAVRCTTQCDEAHAQLESFFSAHADAMIASIGAAASRPISH